ncbi:aldo/keto reductase [Paractinoplanes brasiliensis]|uniref:Aryl-alcohol dehydrogenase-like predicted oxidoreductase n=1 Tax=Paractinoplanes brasiliensis TaxID=52695 RepID=A0A4R6JLQ5_9ACTN|nr:aldo/keto reductase [Actinoplanes brasiliensis]TDO37069.1 aryl-alcohol dehydrogenase-like predicted oxidoreductase [Actinoplanes brasiliensis]GID32237.1 aldo/keto reductase [Actinoplanes brasiliensis]
MELTDYRTFGRTGLRVSPLTLGTMNFGDAGWGADEASAEAIIDRYLEAGGNILDTANGYTGGNSEEVIGGYLAKRPGRRDRVVLATKFAGSMFPGDPNGGGAGRKAIRHQLEASLRRLGTDYIDLYWLHNQDPHTPLEETLGTLEDLVRAGHIRYIGLSDTPAWAVARLATIAELRGWSALAGIQVEYSLLERTVEGELFAAVRGLGLGVTPWSPLHGGVLTGKYTRSVGRPTDSGRAKMGNADSLPESTYVLLDELAEIADRLNTTVASVALAWVTGRAEVTTTIIGVRTVEQLDANLGSLRVEIPAADLARLDELTRVPLPFPFPMLEAIVPTWQQPGVTINGVVGPSRAC